MSHWRTLAAIDAEFVVVSETRTNRSEQEVISRAVRSQGWDFVWAEPIIPGPNSGMQGRSGGTAIMHKDTWEYSERFALDLEAAPPKQSCLPLYPQVQWVSASCCCLLR